MLISSGMRRTAHVGTVLSMLACVAGCGKISFGDDLVMGPDVGSPEDAGVIMDVPDVGDPIDMGVPEDVGPQPDGGDVECLPVTLPPTPMDWPFGTDRASYEAVFWTWANGQTFSCASGACHGGDTVPRIPTGGDLGNDYRRGINEIWNYLYTENTEYSGRLWRHHVDYDGPDGREDPPYEPGQVDFLKELLHSAWACAAAPAIEAQDAGPACGSGEPAPDAGEPPDTGEESDGGDPADAGDTDGEPPEAGPPADAGMLPPCYCDLPDVGPLSTTNCAP